MKIYISRKDKIPTSPTEGHILQLEQINTRITRDRGSEDPCYVTKNSCIIDYNPTKKESGYTKYLHV